MGGIPHSNLTNRPASEHRSGARSASEGSALLRSESLKKPTTPPTSAAHTVGVALTGSLLLPFKG